MTVDLEATWQEHKRFLTRVGAGALAFGLLSFGIGGIESATGSLAKRNAGEHGDLLRAMMGLRGAEAAEKGKKLALEEKAAPAIQKAIAWSVDARFVPTPEDLKNPSIAYLRRTALAAEEVGKHADKAGAVLPRKAESRLPDLSVEEGTGLEPARAAEALARVDVARRVLIAAIDAGVQKITAVRQPEASYSPLEGNGGFLRRIPVAVSFEGGAVDLARILDAFEGEGTFLELGACRVSRARDSRPEDGRLEVELELAALTVEKDAPDGQAAKGSGDGGEPVRRTPKRRRD